MGIHTSQGSRISIYKIICNTITEHYNGTFYNGTLIPTGEEGDKIRDCKIVVNEVALSTTKRPRKRRGPFED